MSTVKERTLKISQAVELSRVHAKNYMEALKKIGGEVEDQDAGYPLYSYEEFLAPMQEFFFAKLIPRIDPEKEYNEYLESDWEFMSKNMRDQLKIDENAVNVYGVKIITVLGSDSEEF